MTTSNPTLALDTADLLSRAVHKNAAWSANGISERLFTWAFGGLVYAQIWEDPAVDMDAMELNSESRIATIASGGCNALSYLSASPESVVALDLNATHIALNKLKKVAAARLDYAGFRGFIEGTEPDISTTYDVDIAPYLDTDTRSFWSGRDKLGRRRIDVLGRNIFRTGLLGRFIGTSHGVARLLGVDPREILTSRSIEEQKLFFDERLAPLFERRVLRAILSHPASLFGLGIPPAQYRELGAAGPTMAEVVRERLRKLACDFPLDENYFAWQAFNRGYGDAPDAPRPPYLERMTFPLVQANIERLAIEQGSVTDVFERAQPGTFNRFVLLDAQDWMSPDELTRLWRAIDRIAEPGSRVIFRTAGTASILPGRIPEDVMARWDYHEERSASLHACDRSAIYGGFHLYSKGG